MTVPGAVDLLRELKSEYGTKLLLGAGTVTTAAQVEATIDAGAEFVVSPSLHSAVISTTKSRGKLSIPGALTPTEVITAWEAGADYVKIFPCSAMGGAGYLKSLLAPFPFLKLIPTGGVTVQSAESFLRAGAHALGVGSDLVNLAAIEAGTPEIITETARAYLQVLAQVRSKSELAL
jgi:2-dehydro-3-deoxyphosphogluconate aldolase/(4S)-4-hydroxy-2-oxoglutarate aldolase